MPRIWKYEVPAAEKAGEPVTVILPRGATILPNSVAFQAKPEPIITAEGRSASVSLVFWAYVEGDAPNDTEEERRFLVLGTGWEFEVPIGGRAAFLGTAFVDRFVFHLFEILEEGGLQVC